MLLPGVSLLAYISMQLNSASNLKVNLKDLPIFITLIMKSPTY